MDLHRVDAKMIKKAAFKTGIIGNSTDQPVLEQCQPMGFIVCSAGESDIHAPAGRGLDEIIEHVARNIGHGGASFSAPMTRQICDSAERECAGTHVKKPHVYGHISPAEIAQVYDILGKFRDFRRDWEWSGQGVGHATLAFTLQGSQIRNLHRPPK